MYVSLQAYIDIAVALECALDTFPDELLFACNASISMSPSPTPVMVNGKAAGSRSGSGGSDSIADSASGGSYSGSGVSGSDGGTAVGGINGVSGDGGGAGDSGAGDGDGGVTMVSVASSYPELKLLNFPALLPRQGLGTAEKTGLAATAGGVLLILLEP